jgi:hypothetical protein
MKIVHRNHAIHTSRSRDAALRRLTSTNRWLIAGSAVLTGLLTDVAANAFSGHTKQSSPAGSAKHHAAKHKPLQPPRQAPRATTTQAAPQAPAETTPQEPAAPTQEAAPEAQRSEASPEAEAQAPPEAAPAPESSGPVVSGGS